MNENQKAALWRFIITVLTSAVTALGTMLGVGVN